MAKVSPLINNFSAGEFGPLTSARVDLDRYGQSAEEMTNFIPTIQGAAQKRVGTKYVASAKTSATNCRLQSFIFSNDQSYILEIGQAYIRFYTEGARIESGGNPVETTTTYSSSEIFDLSFTQSNDIIYFFHKDHPTRKLIRFSDTDWQIFDIDFNDGPYNEINPNAYSTNQPTRNAYAIVASAGSGNITLTNFARVINNATNSSGRILISTTAAHGYIDGSRVYIAGVTGTTEANGTWIITVISSTTFVLQSSTFVNAYISGGGVYIAPFYSTDVGRLFRHFDGTTWAVSIITGYTSPVQVSATVLVNYTSYAAADYLWRFGTFSETTGYPSSGCFFEDRLCLVGPNQSISLSKSGDYENFSPTSSTGVVADNDGINFVLNSSDSSQCRWATSDEKGILIGTSTSEYLIKSASTQTPITPTSVSAKKVTAYGSSSTQPIQAGKATVFVQASARKLREFNYFFDVDGFRCQDLNQLAHHITKFGIKQLAIQKQPEQIIWAVRNDGVLLGLTYERDVDGLRVAWHKHILGGTKNANGDEVDVLSVACIPTSDNSYDEVWLLVGRLINGTYAYSIEYMGKPFDEEVEQEDQFFVDCGLTYDSSKTVTNITKANPAVVTSASHGFANGDLVRFDDVEGMTEVNGNIYKVANQAANTFELTTIDGDNIDSSSFSTYFSGGEVRKLVTTISGLSHLNGQQVTTLCDGGYGGLYTVSSGSITLNNPAAVVHVGLKYEAKLKLPRLEAGSSNGTALAKTRRIHRLSSAVYRTTDLKYGQDFDEMNNFEVQDADDQMNQAPELYTGILTTEADFQYDFDNNICLMNDRPNNCTVLAVMPNLDTQDR